MTTINNNFNCSCCANLYTNTAQNISPMISLPCGHDICSFCVDTLKSTASTKKPRVPLRCLNCNIPIIDAYPASLNPVRQIGSRFFSSTPSFTPPNPLNPSLSPQELLPIWTEMLSLGLDSIEKNCDAALACLENAFRFFNRFPPETNEFFSNNLQAMRASILQGMGRCYQKKNEPTIALEYFTQAFEIQKSFIGDNHLSLLPALMGIGWCYFEAKNYLAALECYQKALNIHKSCSGERQPSQLPLLNTMAICHLNRRDSLNEDSSGNVELNKHMHLLNAFNCLKQARHCFNRSFQPNNFTQIFTLQQLINCTKLLNDKKRGKKYTKELKTITPTPT